MNYFIWPIGALSLGLIAVAFWKVNGQLLGVSGLMEKVLTWNKSPSRISPASALVFLLMMVAGGLVAQLQTGQWQWQTMTDAAHAELFGGLAASRWVYVLGGLLVGFGVRMGNGCTSGHGLSGCSRFQPRSLVATAAFFGTAVVTSLLLKEVLS